MTGRSRAGLAAALSNAGFAVVYGVMPVALVLSTRIVPLMVGIAGIFLLASIFVAGDMRALFVKFRIGAGKPLTLIALLLCALALMAPLLGSPVPLDIGTTARFAGSFGLILAWWALANIAPPPDRSLLINISAAGVAIAAALIVLELETRFGIRHMLGISLNPSILNRPIVVTLVLAALLVSDVRDRHERVAFLLVAITTLAATATGETQSATLFLVAFSATYVLARLLPRPVLVLGTVATAGLLLAAPFLFGGMSVPDIPALADFMREAHVEHRILIWHDYATLVFERPVFGYGLGAEHVVVSKINDTTGVADPTQWHPHSMPLQLWVNFGLIGAVVFTGALLMVLRRIGRIEPGHQAGALALYAGLFAVAGVSHGAWQEWWMVLVGFALVEAIRRSGPIPAKAP